MARPIKDAEEKLSERVMVRLTPAEWQGIQRDAAAAGISAAELIRRRGVRDQKEIVAKAKPSAIDEEALRVIRKSGNNLNQIAAVLNRASKEGKISDAHVMMALITLQEIHDQHISVLENGRSDNRRR